MFSWFKRGPAEETKKPAEKVAITAEKLDQVGRYMGEIGYSNLPLLLGDLSSLLKAKGGDRAADERIRSIIQNKPYMNSLAQGGRELNDVGPEYFGGQAARDAVVALATELLERSKESR